MNHLKIETQKLPNPDDRRRPRYVADIYIDGRSLDDLLIGFATHRFTQMNLGVAPIRMSHRMSDLAKNYIYCF